jgi:hypothetical protein
MKQIEALQLALILFVFPRILDLAQQGGPTESDIAQVKGYDLLTHTRQLLYLKEGTSGPQFIQLVDTIAVLAFLHEDGITVFGIHFDVGVSAALFPQEKPV